MNRKYDHLPKTVKEAKELGSILFFTNRKCKYNHISPRYTRSYRCVECQKESSKKYQRGSAKWKEYLRDYQAEYRNDESKQEKLLHIRHKYLAKKKGLTVEEYLAKAEQRVHYRELRAEAKERGDKIYFGKDCNKCGANIRYVSSNGCKTCHATRYMRIKKEQ